MVFNPSPETRQKHSSETRAERTVTERTVIEALLADPDALAGFSISARGSDSSTKGTGPIQGTGSIQRAGQIQNMARNGGSGPSGRGRPDPEDDDETPRQSSDTAKKTKSKTPTLDAFCTDLTERARNGGLDPVIGRETEVERAIEILSRRTKNNPVFTGEAGVGKTAIVEGVAQKIVSGEVPEVLLNKRVMMLDLTAMVAGTTYRGQFEERLQGLMKEVRKAGNIILFVDELHTLVSAGGAEGSLNASNTLKPALSRGEIQCIGATTTDEYRKYVEKDAALARRFQPVLIDPPTVSQTIEILKGLSDRYGSHHGVVYTPEALKAAAVLSDKYVHGRHLPDKAIDVIDEAGARVRIFSDRQQLGDLNQFAEREAQIAARKAEAIEKTDFALAKQVRQEERELERDKAAALDPSKHGHAGPRVVTEDDIREVMTMMTGIPLTRVTEEEAQSILELERDLNERVIGQPEACRGIARAVVRARAGLRDGKRPISIILPGPTGVGKTHIAKTLAELLFQDEKAFVPLDMSEYMEKHNVSRLVGAPPGYIGYEEGGQLTEKVRRRPYCVVLLDEIEKAHPDVFNVLLQVLEDGRLTDGQGRVVHFENTIILMTTNLGGSSGDSGGVGKFGFHAMLAQRDPARPEDRASKAKHYKAAVEESFRPEFINRIDEIIPCNALGRDDQLKILSLELDKVAARVEAKGMELEVKDDARLKILQVGYDPIYGARPLRRTVESMVEDALTDLILRHGDKAGRRFVSRLEGDKLEFDMVDPVEVAVQRDGASPAAMNQPRATERERKPEEPLAMA